MPISPTAVLAKIRIQIPAEAVVPLIIGVAALLVLLFAGAAFAHWKARHPKVARTAGLVLAIAMSGYAVFLLVQLMPEKYIDLGPPTGPPISLADGPVLGMTAVLATLFWRFANLRKVALGFGVVVGAALIVKPWVVPLYTWFDGHERARVLSDPDTLSILGPGLVVLIVALIAGLTKQPRVGQSTSRP